MIGQPFEEEVEANLFRKIPTNKYQDLPR